MSDLAAVVLAAGASRRLGQSKQWAVVGGETLLARAVRTAQHAGLAPVYVVMAQAEPAGALGQGVQMVVNHEASEGIASSVRAGVAACAEAEGVVLLTCDQPTVTAEHLRALTTARREVTASCYAGRRGVPAYFPRASFASLLALRGDSGARDLLQQARCLPLLLGELDVDTPEDLARAQAMFRSER
ncbi:MAG: nucleotidyltransferase family protein [Acidobacteriota bacterium]|nr:nucleotidyltransferase family protein [Acidobacteriota bacterium]